MNTPAPTFLGRLWRWTKRLTLVATLTALTAASVIGFGAPALSRTPWARIRVEKALTRAFGTPVQISSLAFSWKNGLALRGINAAAAFRADELVLQPRYSKLVRGQVRVRATLEKPELMIVEGASAVSARLPRLPKKGLRIDSLDLREGSITAVTGAERRTVRLDHVAFRGDARVEDRMLRVELANLSGDCDGLAFSGKGRLRVSRDGLTGEVEVREPAATESSSLRDALRAVHLTVKKAPVLSEPF